MIRILYFLLVLLMVNAYSQVNIESARSHSEKGQLNRSHFLNFNSSVSKSITSFYSLGVDYFKRLTINELFHGFYLTRLNYGKRSSSDYINNEFHHFRLISNHNLMSVIPEIYAQYERDAFAATELRYLFGIGIRYSILDTIVSGTSLLSEWCQENDDSVTDHQWRISQYIKIMFQLTTDNFIQSTIYIQPNIQDISDIRFLLDGAFISKLNDLISYKLSILANYYSESSSYDDIELFLTSGLEFGF